MRSSTSRRMRGALPPAPALRAVRALVLLLAALSGGCAGAVPTLPVRHVVVYRNGVAYFERGGRVHGGRVGFRTRAAGVSDLLATLAVSEPTSPRAADPGPPAVRTVDLESHADDRESGASETVVLTLDGKAHDLDVGYIAASPIWKPSYRLMLYEGGAARLQIWGVVENASGEDWKDVGLSLVAGAPIAYESDLNARVVPARPMVTDHGQAPIAVPAPIPGYRFIDDPLPAQGRAVVQGQVASSTTVASSRSVRPMMARAVVASADPPAGRSIGGLAVGGGSTRYDVRLPVSIADQSASMVLVEDEAVTGEEVLLYAPDAGVAESSTHLFRAVRFANGSGGALEPGPMALFEDGTFLGQGVVDALSSRATGTVPYAIEPDVTVARETRADDVTGGVVGSVWGPPTLQRERLTRTSYHFQSAMDRPASLVVKHVRTTGTRLKSAPDGTRENVAAGVAMIPVTLPAGGAADAVVEESTPVGGAVDWLSASADLAVRAFLADPKSDATAVKKLSEAWAVRADVLKRDEERSTLRLAGYDLAREAAARKGPETAAKVAANARRLSDVEGQLAQLKTRFEKLVGEVRVTPGS